MPLLFRSRQLLQLLTAVPDHIRKLAFCSTILVSTLALSPAVVAQTSSQRSSVQLAATVQSSPVRITLSWTALSSTTSITIHRKLRTATTWTSVASPSASSTSYEDNAVSSGVVYEYKVTRVAGGRTGTGYICTGINVPPVDYRGKIILLVDNTFTSSLSAELQQLQNDLRADGWAVLRSDLARTASVATVKSTVISHYNSDPQQVKALFIVGHLAVPYSGNINPDGHSEHQGAWPCDGYYGELNGSWTDNSVNNGGAARAENRNTPGDGKFDQSNFPSDLELQVGRLDMYDMPAFSTSETELMRSYLNKLHSYKIKGWSPTVRGLVFDNLQWVSNPLAASAWRSIAPLVGAANITAANQNSTPFYSLTNDQSYLWTYASGGGLQATASGVLTYNGASNVGTTQNYAASSMGGVFNMSFGSYFGDWDNRNNFLRAPLASGQALTNCWAAIPAWYFHHMGMGENIGSSVLATMNNSSTYTPLTDGWQSSMGRAHLALMGDPSLRMKMVAPPTNLAVSNQGGLASFTWTASSEQVLGYYLYEINASSGVITRLNTSPVTTTSWSSGAIPFITGKQYMVRAVKLETSVSGSYNNLSLGSVATAQGSAAADCNGVVGGSALPGTACNDGNPCTVNDTWSASCQCVGVNAITSATITPGGSTALCTGGSVTLSATTGSGYGYSWRRNGTVITGATSSSYAATLAGSYTVQVTASGCSVLSSAVAVTVNPLPSASITASGSTTFCSGGAVTLNANTGTGLSYVWRRNGSTISGATASSYNATQAGAYTVVVSSNGCAATSSGINVVVNQAPSATITPASSTTICTGGSVVLNASTGSGYTYVWRRNGSVISGATSSSYSASQTGSYTVQTTAAGCSATSTAISISAGSAPSATITAGGATTFCGGGSVLLSANTGSGLSYQWRRNGSSIAGATTSTYSATLAGTYTVVVSAGGCSTTSAGLTVTVTGAPTATISTSGALGFCTGGSVVLSASTGSGYTYVWRRNGSTISGATSTSYTATLAGSYTVSISAGGCTTTSSAVTVTVNAQPSASITAAGGTSFCTGSSLSLTANTGSGLTYQWRRNGTSISGATANTYVATLAGTYTVVVSAGGCSATSNGLAITTKAPPVVSCSVTGTTVTTSVSGGAAPYTYSWSGGGTGSSFTASNSGSYTVTVTGSNGCTASCTAAVTISSSASCSGIRTEAQGTWGAPATSNNPAAYMTTRFANAFPAPNYLTLGCGSRLLRFTTPAAVIASLPTYGMPAVLASGTAVNPGSSVGNTLVGQLTAAKLNVRFDELDAAFMSSTVLLKNMIITSGTFSGWTVQQLITTADQVIGGCSSAYSPIQVSSALASVNNGYDGGTTNSGFLTCPGSGMAPEPEEEMLKMEVEPGMEVLAFPNPFSDRTEVRISGASGSEPTTVEIYSMTGVLIEVLFTGTIAEDEQRSLTWQAADRAKGFYFYRVTNGERSVTGKLLLQ